MKYIHEIWPTVHVCPTEQAVDGTQATEFAKIMVPLFKQVAKCLNSSHFQVGNLLSCAVHRYCSWLDKCQQ